MMDVVIKLKFENNRDEIGKIIAKTADISFDTI